MLIVKRRLGDTEVETFEISEEDLKRYKTVSASSGQISCNKEAVDVYKMEYETCARRYNDIYTSAWTNFSYMALFAGGILTFGGSRFIVPVTVFLACLPLLFWWCATFEPLNKYGDQVLKDLADIEQSIDAQCFPKKSLVAVETRLGSDAVLSDPANKGLTHFRRFATRYSGTSWVPRVRLVVRITGGILLITAIGFGVKTAQLYRSGKSLIVPQPQAVVLDIKQ